MYPGDPVLAATVSASLMAVVVVAKTIGGILPILAKAVNADPAIMASPVITTIVDAAGLLIYFKIVEVILL